MAIVKYQNSIADSATGRPISNVSIQVFDYPSGTAATIYDSAFAVTTAPIITDKDGAYSFYVENGNYDIVYYYGGITKRLVDVLVGGVTGAPGPASSGYTLLSSYGSLAAMVATVSTANQTVAIDADTTLTANITIPANIELLRLNGAVINADAYTLTGLKVARPEWFGAFTDNTNATATTAAVNKALLAAPKVIFSPGNTYSLNGDITLNTGNHIVIEKGATVINTGGRFTAYLVNNVALEVDGELSSVALATAPQKGDWPVNINGANTIYDRGFIEFGGSIAAPSTGFKVFGTGKIHGDWTGTPSITTLWTDDINKKGIAAWFASDVLIKDLEVYGFKGEAVYYYTSVSRRNVIYDGLYVHDTNFNGMNFNCTVPVTNAVMRNCKVDRAYQPVELSVGTVENCDLSGAYGPTIMFGGGYVFTVNIQGNLISGSAVSNNPVIWAMGNASSVAGIVTIKGNRIAESRGSAIEGTNLASLIVTGNDIYHYAFEASGSGVNADSTVVGATVKGNTFHLPGAYSVGPTNVTATYRSIENNSSRADVSASVIQLDQGPYPAATDLAVAYRTINGLSIAGAGLSTKYANVPAAGVIRLSDTFVSAEAQATSADASGTIGKFVVKTYKATTGATADTSLVVKSSGVLSVPYTPEYADNAAALAGGLVNGDFYRTGDLVKQVHP